MLVRTIESVADWLSENVCEKIMLKIPDDSKNNNEYTVRVVHPAAFPLYVPGKDRLPPDVPAPVPSICVQLIEGSDNLFSRSRTLNIRLVMACWNPGIHGNERFIPEENKNAVGGRSYFIRNEENNQVYQKTMDGWKDSMNFQGTVLSELEKSEYIAGNRIMKEEEIKFGLFSEEGDICDYYPYWHSWISFRLAVGLNAKSPKIYENYL